MLSCRFQKCLRRFDMLTANGALKRGYLNIRLTISFTVFHIHRLWKSSYFSKCSKFDADFKDGETYGNKVLVFYIMSFDIVPLDSNNYKENTSHRKSIFQHRVVKVQIWITETFSKSVSLRVTKQFFKSILRKISQVFVTP